MAAIGLARLSSMEDHTAIQEAASAGLRSMEHLVRVLSGSPAAAAGPSTGSELREAADFTVARFKQVISVLNRTGHARFRRGPTPQTPPAPVNYDQSNKAGRFPEPESPPEEKTEEIKIKASPSAESLSSASQHSSSSSFLSSVTTGDGSVSNGNKPSGSILLFPTPIPFSGGKPPLAGKKRSCHDAALSGGKANSGTSNCHCQKKRKDRFRKTVRVPAISSKMADIPQDEYGTWRKYGQKPIKGSPFPRGYYKCSSVKGCPAKKHVERSKDDPAMLIITYEWEHSHPSIPTAPAGPSSSC